MTTNQDRQADEIEALLSICDTDEFHRLPGSETKLLLEVSPRIDKGILDVRYTNLVQKHAKTPTYRHFGVRNLPPASLRLWLPPGYPDKEPPWYKLEISWLPPWECSLICQRLDAMWDENSGYEIIFLWREFLQGEILDFLGYGKSLDVTFLFALHREIDDPATIALLQLGDSRAENSALFQHPMTYLTLYDKSRTRVVFDRTILICEICSLQQPGEKCAMFADCGHSYCKECTAAYIATKIQSGAVKKIFCPEPNCYRVAQSSLIKELCPNLYSKYEQLLLDVTLHTMNDVVFCPRIFCQQPVIITPDESLATCRNCEYNFCFYCRKVYHGVAPCFMDSEDTTKLIEAYLRGSEAEKRILVNKYGRRQIQTVVEKHLTKDYIKAKTKPCPGCDTPTEKIGGCNKMICAHCRANFCWLCGIVITSANKYEHFTSFGSDNKCYGRLFEGMCEADLEMVGGVEAI